MGKAITKQIILLVAFSLLFSCNNMTRKDNDKTNLNKNKIDSTKSIDSIKSISSIDTSSKIMIDPGIPHEYPFDTILNNCFQSPGEDGQLNGGTTMGMIDCYDYSTTKLDTLVNKIYKKLYSKLDNKDKLKLKKSQNNWRKFYISESDFVFSAYYTWANLSKYGHGREHAITQAEWRYDVMRKRLIDLTKYEAEIFTVDEK